MGGEATEVWHRHPEREHPPCFSATREGTVAPGCKHAQHPPPVPSRPGFLGAQRPSRAVLPQLRHALRERVANRQVILSAHLNTGVCCWTPRRDISGPLPTPLTSASPWFLA